MKRYTLLLAALSLVLIVVTTPALAQSVNVAQLVNSESPHKSATSADKVEHEAVVFDFPTLRKAMPNLVYPVKAKRFQVEGRVVIEYTVDTDGRAKDMEIIEGPGFGCEEEVQRVLKGAHFEPLLDTAGQPVETRYRSAFDFRLQ